MYTCTPEIGFPRSSVTLPDTVPDCCAIALENGSVRQRKLASVRSLASRPVSNPSKEHEPRIIRGSPRRKSLAMQLELAISVATGAVAAGSALAAGRDAVELDVSLS